MRRKARKKERPLRKGSLLAIIIILVAVSVVLIPFLVWFVRPSLDIFTVVYNKTVPDSSIRQHVGIMWFLKQAKVPTARGETFDYERDYYGYFPDAPEEERIQPLPLLAQHIDMVYIADTYGVYKETTGLEAPTLGTSNVIYGGMNQQDVDVLQEYLNRDRPNTLVAEYNTFGTPTPYYIQAQLYEMLRVRWTGWIGQYMADLSKGKTVPQWAVDRYERNTGETWLYSGPGFLFTDEENEVFVLEMGMDIGAKGNQLNFTPEGSELFDLSGERYYNHIFDIVQPLAGVEVLATYTLDVTDSGARKLQEAGLTASFPAITRSTTAFHSTYYLAGNFADLPYTPNFHFLAWVPQIMTTTTTDTLESEKSFYWNTYIPVMSAIYQEAQQRKQTPIPEPLVHIATVEGTQMVSRTKGNMLQVYQDNDWRDLFIHGVNIGIAMPGKWFTEFPKDKTVYYRWLTQIGEMQANTVRIYTLLDPEFYSAFALYNRLHPDQPLWLMQEIWPEEEPHGGDYLSDDYRMEFEQEIRHVVDAVHGNASIAERQGRAYGEYHANVAPYIIGYLVGRELEPQEVEATNILNPAFSFTGEYLKAVPGASPTEAWLAEGADYVLAYQEETYGWQHPVAIVNWPTLDALAHESERDEFGQKIREYNDRTSVDINSIEFGPKMKGGLFGAYHIYPNYPDFMNNEPAYDQYFDQEGRFRYGGYLQQFMEIHTQYPAVIAEFGLATGMGNAHYSPDGYHHGSMTEQVQGDGIIRMYEAMETEGYAGGIIFEWMDEWAKKTWTTEPYMIPYDRHILWHNAIDPEQNYGILALESVKPIKVGAAMTGDGTIDSIELRLDASYLYIDISLTRPLDFTKEQLLIGLDTYDRERGELRYRDDLPYEAPSGMEYLVVLDGPETARLLVIPPYNYASYRYASYPSLNTSGTFESMAKLINKERALADGTPIPAHFEDSSALRYGHLIGSTNNWNVQGTAISLRIPWGRINVSDPSQGRVLDDNRLYYSDPLRDVLDTRLSDGIAISIACIQNETRKLLGSLPATGESGKLILPWVPWNQPIFQERLKDSYPILRDYFIRKTLEQE
jgi:hypothetical protein